MRKKDREEVPPETAALVLFLSDRTCCVCRIRGKPIQVHHIDEDPSNNDRGNLAVVCFDCHRDTQIKGGFDRKLDALQILLYRDDWLRLVSQRLAESYAGSVNATSIRRQDTDSADQTGEYLFHTNEPVILWRMPRGCLVLGNLLAGPPGWATVADYCSYHGAWKGSTHYHVSYRPFLWQEVGGFERECRKLQIERADFPYARKPLELLSEIRDGRVQMNADGKLEGAEGEVDRYRDPELMRVFVQEDVPFPRVPERYFRLSISGSLRDIAATTDDLCLEVPMELPAKRISEEIKNEIKRLRRAARIEAHKLLAKDDPAMINLVEVIQAFDPNADYERYYGWTKEFRAVLHDAVEQVHATRQ